MKQDTYYISTTLPYTNSEPHIGFAAEIIRADVLARLALLEGKELVFNTGTDEHGLKIYIAAKASGLEPREYCTPFAKKFQDLKEALDLKVSHFIRTSDKGHKEAVAKFWQLCLENGDIYKKKYQAKYCTGCELEKTDSDLVKGKCPVHPSLDLDLIDEENYFFRFSKYQAPLLELYDKQKDFVYPSHRLKEIKNFVAKGLSDFSISRLKSKMPNGIPVPGDSEQVIYVWFDALVNYISTIGWPKEQENFEKFWPLVQVCGKDNLRQQAAMWQAMLLSAKLPVSKQILIFGFITQNGKKISKSAGNAIELSELLARYSSDTLRYYILREILAFEDSDFNEEHLKSLYNSDLANGLGNLVSRLSNLLEKNEIPLALKKNEALAIQELAGLKKDYNFAKALKTIWQEINACNEELSRTSPWKLEDREEIAQILVPLAQKLLDLAFQLQIFLPQSAAKIIAEFSKERVKKMEILFPRLISNGGKEL